MSNRSLTTLLRAHRAMDRELFIVECRINGESVFMERKAIDASFDRTVEDILQGQFEGLLTVLYFNPREGVCRDESEDVARAVVSKARNEYRALARGVHEFIEEQLGVGAARGVELVSGEVA